MFSVLLLIVTATSMLVGCGNSGSAKFDDGFGENVLRISYDHECESGDARKTTRDYIIQLNVFDTLVEAVPKKDDKVELKPGLAESWEISDDGLTYKFHLRKGIKYTNGEELKADDVLYTIDSMLDPERKAVNTSWMDMLAGAKEVLDGKSKTIEGKGFIAHDDYNFDLVLEEAYAPFLATLTTPSWSILNRKACDEADKAGGGKTGSYFGSEPKYTIGTGPFKLKEWVLNDHIFMEANKDYWKGAPKIDGILIKVVPDADTEKMMFDKGQLDIFDLDDARNQLKNYEKDDKWKNNLVSKVTFGTTYLSINEKIKPFDDVRVRKALQMAIDRKTILDTLYEGQGIEANGIFPPNMIGYNKNLPEIKYDPEGAKKLLAEAGYPNGFDMEITATSSDSKSGLDLLQIVSENFAKIGIKAKINQMDEASWYDIRSTGELPMYSATWWGDFNDPNNFIYTFFSADANVSRSFNYYNADVIKRIDDARHMTDQEARMKEYQDLEKIVIHDDAAMIPMFHLKKVRVVQDRVKNFVPHWAGWGDCNYFSVELKK